MENYHLQTMVPLDEKLLDEFCWYEVANNPDGHGILNESGCTRDTEEYLRQLRELYFVEEIPIKASVIRRACRDELAYQQAFEEEAITFVRDLFNQNGHCGFATFTDNDLVNSDGATYKINSYDARDDNYLGEDEFLQIIKTNADGTGYFVMIDDQEFIVQQFESQDSNRRPLSLLDGISVYMRGNGSIADVVSVVAVNGLVEQASYCDN